MNVQELINSLSKVNNKELVVIDEDGQDIDEIITEEDKGWVRLT
jgi:hypothetical protein